VRSRLDFDEPFEVVQVTPAIMHAGVDLHPTRSIGYLDAIVLASAHTAGCDRLWTKDMNAGEMINAVRIVNPFLDV